MKKTSTLSLMTLGIFSVFSLTVSGQAFNEGFESGACPPAGWTAQNPDGLTTWVASSAAAKSGTQSAFIDIFNSDANGGEKGQEDGLITGTLNLSNLSNTSLTFYYAYQMYSDPGTYTTHDSLVVSSSTDGGTTWSDIYFKAGNTLVTAATQFDPNAGYVPASSEWMMETVNISSVATAPSVQFKFALWNDWENNMYLDDIVLAGTAGGGVHELDLSSQVVVYPNPATGPVFVNFASYNFGNTEIIVYNMLGEAVQSTTENIVTAKRIKLDLDGLPNGSYFVKVKTAEGSATKKVMLNR